MKATKEHAESAELDRKKRRRDRIDLAVAILLAICLHLLLIPLMNQALTAKQLPLAQKTKVRLVSLPSKIKKKARPKPEKVPDKQIVSTAEPLMKERPNEADYLAEFDRSTDRNTLSAQTKPHANVTEKAQEGKPEKSSRRSSVETPKKQVEQQPIKSRRKQQSLTGWKPEMQGHEPINLVPSWRELEAYEGMPFNDHLEHVEEDAQTRLNTFEWKHATFFNRMKENVSRAWSPISQIRRYDPEGVLLGKRDRYTVVKVSIDREGRVVEVSIKTPSGVHYLDNEARRAFEVAGPFPNPPKAIFGDNETFSFPFGFYVGFEKGMSLDFDWRPY